MRYKVAVSLLVVLALVVVAACGSASVPAPASLTSKPAGNASGTVEQTMPKTTGTAASVADYCGAVRDNLDGLKAASDDVDSFVAALGNLQKRATRQIRPSLDRVVLGAESLVGLSGDERAAREQELEDDADFTGAAGKLEAYTAENCDVRLTTTPTHLTETTRRFATTQQEAAPSPTTLSRSGSEVLAELQDFLSANYATTPWYQAASKVAISSGRGGVTFKLTVDGSLPPEDAVAACRGVAEFADGAFDDAAVNVVEPGGTVLAHRTDEASGCGVG
ncbi:MAG: hypothetical protein HYX32_13300 [Actinobacteria bacterium]|nr:hypothetical protein [Actinomycetota bacterium]